MQEKEFMGHRSCVDVPQYTDVEGHEKVSTMYISVPRYSLQRLPSQDKNQFQMILNKKYVNRRLHYIQYCKLNNAKLQLLFTT